MKHLSSVRSRKCFLLLVLDEARALGVRSLQHFLFGAEVD
jgi:hypothetical protein